MRLAQSASLIVLFVELMVAVVAITAPLLLYGEIWCKRGVAAAIASLLAYGGLIF